MQNITIMNVCWSNTQITQLICVQCARGLGILVDRIGTGSHQAPPKVTILVTFPDKSHFPEIIK